MGIRWDSTTDQTLLLKILETSSVNVDVKAVAAAWPKDQVAPTSRAVSERLFKIRALAKSSGTAAHFSVSSGRKSNPTTPRKVAARRPKAKQDGVKKSATKRKRREKGLDSSDTDETEPFKGETIDPDDNDLDMDDEEVISPSEKTKRGAAVLRAVTLPNAAIKSELDYEGYEPPMAVSSDGPMDSEGDGMIAEI